jgi:hypothetical protein
MRPLRGGGEGMPSWNAHSVICIPSSYTMPSRWITIPTDCSPASMMELQVYEGVAPVYSGHSPFIALGDHALKSCGVDYRHFIAYNVWSKLLN